MLEEKMHKTPLNEGSLSPVEERLASQIVVDEGGHRSYLGTTKPHLRS